MYKHKCIYSLSSLLALLSIEQAQNLFELMHQTCSSKCLIVFFNNPKSLSLISEIYCLCILHSRLFLSSYNFLQILACTFVFCLFICSIYARSLIVPIASIKYTHICIVLFLNVFMLYIVLLYVASNINGNFVVVGSL